MKLLCVTILLGVLIGCAGGQRQALRQAYDRGELTAAEYYALEQRRSEVQSQKLLAVGQSLQNWANYLQRDRAINAINDPQTIYLYNMTPLR
jgi:hypothetical protein